VSDYFFSIQSNIEIARDFVCKRNCGGLYESLWYWVWGDKNTLLANEENQ
jgi:hypothetical protein